MDLDDTMLIKTRQTEKDKSIDEVKSKEINKTKQKQTHGCREQTDNCQRGSGDKRLSKKGEGIEEVHIASYETLTGM